MMGTNYRPHCELYRLQVFLFLLVISSVINTFHLSNVTPTQQLHLYVWFYFAKTKNVNHILINNLAELQFPFPHRNNSSIPQHTILHHRPHHTTPPSTTGHTTCSTIINRRQQQLSAIKAIILFIAAGFDRRARACRDPASVVRLYTKVGSQHLPLLRQV